jgi:hypothetical protein
MSYASGISFDESALAAAAPEQAETLAPRRMNHLQALEAESIHILREAAAEFARPVMLYSIGKDSSVMLRLAQKAFFPGKIPFVARRYQLQISRDDRVSGSLYTRIGRGIDRPQKSAGSGRGSEPVRAGHAEVLRLAENEIVAGCVG